MNSLVIYDSNFGNTKKVAETVTAGLGPEAKLVAVDEVRPDMTVGLDLLIVGSPINAWKPTAKIGAFLAGLKPGQLAGCRVGTFDTRVKLFIHGDAARAMSKVLINAGAELIGEPQAFIVEGREGPLQAGELERAKVWAAMLAEQTGHKDQSSHPSD